LKSISSKTDDDEGAQYLVRELNNHPMTIAHTAIFLKSVLQNPDNSGFGWKDCLMRLEKLKMGAVGQFNTKQSLALTSILENNHAVSQMAINRLGSVNPYLESAFQFLAFCTRDSLFCIPLDLISDFVMQGLQGEDDVENCKYKNSVDATLRQCPLFLVPKSNVHVKQVAVKDVLPKDTEGIFVSQLPPKTDLLPELGSGSMTAASDVSKKPGSAKKRAETPDQEKEQIRMAETFSSRPGTQEKSVISSVRDGVDNRGARAQREVRDQSRPATHEEYGRPASVEKSVVSSVREGVDNRGARAPREVRDQSRPATQEQGRPASRPASQEQSVVSSVREGVDNRGARAPREIRDQSRPATQETARPASRPASQEQSVVSSVREGVDNRGARAPREVRDQSRPATQEQGRPASRPASEEKSVVSSVREGVDNRGARAPREVRDQSRPATSDVTSPQITGDQLDVRSAPPTPDGTPRKEQAEVKKLEEVDDENTQAAAGEFKPLNSEPPPKVEAGEFKPLMSEPPVPASDSSGVGSSVREGVENRGARAPRVARPMSVETPLNQTPAPPSTPAAKMSSSIEKPGIDGRSSVGERLIETDIVEAAIYGEEIISGTIPIKKTEGDILLKVEDNLRPFEDEVESLTFNEGVHKAFRKFARNMVMRTIKGGQSSSSADTQSQQRKLQLEQFVKATKVLLMCYDKVYSSQEPKDLAFKRMLGPQLAYFVNCMLTKFNFKNRVAVRALKFLADSQCLLGELVKAEETLETAQNIAFQCFHPTDLDLFDILRDRADVLSRLGNKEDCALVLEQCLNIVEQLDGEDMLQKEAGLLCELAQVHSNIGNLSHANGLVERSLSIQESLHGPSSLEICDTLTRMAMLRNKMGEPKQAFNQLQRVMRIQERHDVEKHEFSGTLCNMAAVNAALGEHEKAKVLYQSVLNTQEKQYGQWYPEIATTLSNLAMVHMALGEYEEAKDSLERVMKIRGRIYGKKHPLVASTMTNLASVVYTMGDHNEAMKLNEKALDIQQGVYPDAHPLIAITMKNMAMIENSRSNLEKAKVLYERVLRMEELIYGELHPSVASTLNNLADTVLEQGETAKAAVLFQRAMETNEIVFGKNHPDIARNLNNLGRAFKEMGDYDGSKSKLMQSLKMKEERYGGVHINLVPTLMNLGDLFNLTKQPSRAKDSLTRALKISEKNVGMRHPDTAKILRLLGNSYYLMGDLSTSEKILNRSLDIMEQIYEPDHPHILATRADLGACARPIGTRVF